MQDSTRPRFSLSTREGATARTYVHVQMKRRMTNNNDWKLKRADWRIFSSHLYNFDCTHHGIRASSYAQCTIARCPSLQRDAFVVLRDVVDKIKFLCNTNNNIIRPFLVQRIFNSTWLIHTLFDLQPMTTSVEVVIISEISENQS